MNADPPPGPNPGSRPPRLSVFMTRGMSLGEWERIGILDRELAIYRRLAARGVEVAFVSYGGRDEARFDRSERVGGARVLCNRFGLSATRYEKWAPLLHAPALRRYDVVKTNQTDGAEIAARAARLLRKPLIARCGYMWSEFVERALGAESAEARRARAIEDDVFFRRAARVVVTTEAMANDLRARAVAMSPDGAARGRGSSLRPDVGSKSRPTIPSARAVVPVQVIPNYVETDRFRPDPAPSAEKRFDLAFVGRLNPQKNLDALLEALRESSATLLLIGGGPLEAELKERFGTLDGRVDWRGRADHAELPALLNSARAFVLPSLYEGHPKALLEAMACGLAPIGADAPGIREEIRDGDNGLLCGTDAASIRVAVGRLLADPDLRARLGERARETVVERYSLDRVAALEAETILEVARESRPGVRFDLLPESPA